MTAKRRAQGIGSAPPCLLSAWLFVLSGCATSFDVHEAMLCVQNDPRCEAGPSPERPPALEAPSGVVVNARAVYTTKIYWRDSSGELRTLDGGAVAAVDARRVLVVNMDREAFADGKLELDLNAAQQIERIAVTSTSHAPEVLQAAQKAVEFRKELLKAKEAKKKDKATGEKTDAEGQP